MKLAIFNQWSPGRRHLSGALRLAAFTLLATCFLLLDAGAQNQKPVKKREMNCRIQFFNDSLEFDTAFNFFPKEFMKQMLNMMSSMDTSGVWSHMRQLPDSAFGFIPKFHPESFQRMQRGMEQMRRGMEQMQRSFEDGILPQIGDSVELFKLPDMRRGLIMEAWGDSISRRIPHGFNITVPFDKPGGEGMAIERIRRHRPFVRYEIQQTSISDIPMLIKSGVKKGDVTNPPFADDIKIEIADTSLMITATPASGSFKKLELRLINEAGTLVVEEKLKNAKGVLSRVYPLEANQWYYISLSDGKNFKSNKIKVTKK
jgi:hypothetical protein